jgi:50S ribosomal protein L16 3-hydroxylase
MPVEQHEARGAAASAVAAVPAGVKASPEVIVPDGGFWPHFAARYYGREPFETDDPPAGLEVSGAELFRLLLRAAADRGAGPRAPQVRFHAGQRQVLADLADYMPVATDRTVDGYLARMDHQLGGEPYLLTVEHGHVSSREIWKRAASFLSGLYAASGVLPGSVDLEVFVGRYPYTIPGIHRERSGVFVSMVQGSKDILVWPPDATGLPLGSARYQRATGTSRRLRCAPGRLVYWPAMHWHVGESPAQGTAGLHIAVLDDPLTARDLMTGTSELDTAIATGISPGWAASPPHDLALPPELDAAVESVASAYADQDAVRDRLVAGWLRRRTALGFPTVPPGRKVALRRDQVLTRDGVHPIVVAPRDAASAWVAADGRVGYARPVAALVPLIDRLNSGQPVQVSEALDLATESRDRDVLLKVLTLLASWRALATGAAAQPVEETADPWADPA